MSNANRHIDQKATRLNPKPLILNKYSSGTIYDRCDIIDRNLLTLNHTSSPIGHGSVLNSIKSELEIHLTLNFPLFRSFNSELFPMQVSADSYNLTVPLT